MLSRSGKFIEDLLSQAFPTSTQEKIALEHLGVSTTTLSKWVNGKQRISPQKGHRLTIARVLIQASTIEKENASDVWSAYDHLWSVDKEEPFSGPVPSMAANYVKLDDRDHDKRSQKRFERHTLPLYVPSTDLQTLHFSARSLPMLGREIEYQAVLEFLNSEASFSWMQVAGVGGQGKSRMALELVLEAIEQGWDAGFIHPSDMQLYFQEFKDWDPAKPTLIVVDYIIGYEAEIGDVLSVLADRARAESKVRFLIVERQRWDRGFNFSEDNDDGLSTRRGNGVADWFVRLTRSFSGRSDVFKSTQHEESVVELRTLTPERLVEIVQLWTQYSNSIVEMTDDEVKADLNRIDPKGRPLYAYFFAEALMSGYETDGWLREDLLEATLTREQAHRWATRFDGQAPSLGDRDPALELAVLATLSNGVDTETVESLPEWDRPTATIKAQALVLVDAPLGQTVSGPDRYLGRLEPDILGGWFVLEWLAQAGTRAKWMVQSAWANSPRECAATILRFAQDFPKHPAMETLLSVAPRSKHAERAYVEVASSLLIALRPQIQKHKIQILPRIEAAANEGDIYAISRLGFCCQYAIGLAQRDLQNAMKWYKVGADLGDGRSMAYLGHWFFAGVDGDPDHAKAFEWFQKGADAGDGHAMGYVGVSYLNGIGVKKDPEKGIPWFARGGEAGDGASLVYLGICYLEGMGVEQNDERAFHSFENANELGSSHALAYLGQLYLQGRGVEKNYATAIRFLQDGIGSGSAAAHAFLGQCYRDGLGIDQDIDLALDHLNKGVKGSSGAAMFFLGECYEQGIGVEADFDKAVDLWHEAVRLGEGAAKLKLKTLGLLSEDT